MIRTILLWIIGVTIAVCIYCKLENAPLFMDSEFRQYYEDFVKDGETYGITPDFSLSLTYLSNKVGDGLGGFCLGETKTVVVSKPVWDYLSYPGRKALLYHEWGHCILNRSHNEKPLPGTYCPLSLMYPTIDPLEKCFDYLKPWYTMELFTNPWNDPPLFEKGK